MSIVQGRVEEHAPFGPVLNGYERILTGGADFEGWELVPHGDSVVHQGVVSPHLPYAANSCCLRPGRPRKDVGGEENLAEGVPRAIRPILTVEGSPRLHGHCMHTAVPLVLGESLEGPNLAQRSFGSMARAWGLEECGQLAICDAHARYDDYGVLALPLVLMFPGGLDEEGIRGFQIPLSVDTLVEKVEARDKEA
eukprot:maker-scaffold833_size90787-snap-gene-0.12 protein:Tk11749 transcript:maker-scaffold833_size90787-snap-gene-0.12-mRNA-1 annotation:"putative uncharacterized protein"